MTHKISLVGRKMTRVARIALLGLMTTFAGIMISGGTAQAGLQPGGDIPGPAPGGDIPGPPPGGETTTSGIPCNRFLDQNHRYKSIWTYNTDAQGRPHQAQAGNLRQGRQARSPCETTVGNWGGKGYDGAHLIAATLKGTSQRANLVPATQEVNRTLMKAFENQAKKCLLKANDLVHPLKVLDYTTTVFYAKNSSSVIPTRFTMSMVVQRRIAPGKHEWHVVALAFNNTAYSNAPMTTMIKRMKNAAKKADCPT